MKAYVYLDQQCYDHWRLQWIWWKADQHQYVIMLTSETDKMNKN